MRVLRASEVAEYVFCHRAWWLHQVQGHHSANVRELSAGTAGHARHGRRVLFAQVLRALAVLLVLAAVAAFIVSTLTH